jgi:hypothetical protein
LLAHQLAEQPPLEATLFGRARQREQPLLVAELVGQVEQVAELLDGVGARLRYVDAQVRGRLAGRQGRLDLLEDAVPKDAVEVGEELGEALGQWIVVFVGQREETDLASQLVRMCIGLL